MREQLDELIAQLHALEIRIVKLEFTVKAGGLLLGVIPTALQLWQIFKH